MSVRILVGDCLERLRVLPSESVHCVVTSPPYWGLRSYKGDPGMIGLEPTFEGHLSSLCMVFREVRRVLRKDGTCWLNYGDAYAATSKGSGGTNSFQGTNNKGSLFASPKFKLDGLKPKDLMMMPARVALALQADGWWIRSEIVWHKPNPMPESCTDRPTSAHEKLYLLSKSARYFYDGDAVRVPQREDVLKKYSSKTPLKNVQIQVHQPGRTPHAEGNRVDPNPLGANLRNVWTIPTHSFSEAHFATFPPKLVEPCIKAGTSERGVCKQCGGPWVREVAVSYGKSPVHGEGSITGRRDGGDERTNYSGMPRISKKVETSGWSPTCQCKPQTSVPATVLDPFGGSGTVALVAQRMNRDAILIEISPEYAEMARKRIEGDAPMFADVVID